MVQANGMNAKFYRITAGLGWDVCDCALYPFASWFLSIFAYGWFSVFSLIACVTTPRFLLGLHFWWIGSQQYPFTFPLLWGGVDFLGWRFHHLPHSEWVVHELCYLISIFDGVLRYGFLEKPSGRGFILAGIRQLQIRDMKYRFVVLKRSVTNVIFNLQFNLSPQKHPAYLFEFENTPVLMDALSITQRLLG